MVKELFLLDSNTSKCYNCVKESGIDMNTNITDEYILRISQATPVQLVIINHELLINFLTGALESFEKGEQENFYKGINKTKDALTQLIEGLDFENPIAHDLYNLYQYAGERLNKALFADDTEAAKEVLEMFGELLEGWQAIEDTPDDRLEPSTELNQTPQVFAGLTYGRDGGLEEYIPEDEGRGFKA